MKKRLDEPIQHALFEESEPAEAEPPFALPNIFLGTSSFTAAGWEGSFCPLGMRSKDFLRHYSTQFQTVEIDSTFYGTPAASTVTNWNERTPGDFIFAVKVHRSSRMKRCWLTANRNSRPFAILLKRAADLHMHRNPFSSERRALFARRGDVLGQDTNEFRYAESRLGGDEQ